MKYTIAFNGDTKIFSNLASISKGKVVEMFGVHPSVNSPLGNGRTFSYKKPEVPLASVVKKAKELGINFNYLLNSSCVGPLYANGGLDSLRSFLRTLVSQDISTVTVAEPYLLDFCKSEFPELKVYVSTILQVNSVDKAKYFEEMGADKIILCWNINRDFRLLESIRQAVTIELELLANDWCLSNCPYRFSHYCVSSHVSAASDATPFSLHHYYLVRCMRHRLKNPSLIIKSPWIRPEDVSFYDDLGIDSLKVTERTASTEWNFKTLCAYLNQSFKGNLWSLLADASDTEWIIGCDLGDIFYFDNWKLRDFLSFFIEGKCLEDCSRCSYCDEVTRETLTISDEKLLNKAIFLAENKLKELSNFQFKEDYKTIAF